MLHSSPSLCSPPPLSLPFFLVQLDINKFPNTIAHTIRNGQGHMMRVYGTHWVLRGIRSLWWFVSLGMKHHRAMGAWKPRRRLHHLPCISEILNLKLAASGLQVEEGFPGTHALQLLENCACAGVSRERTLPLWAPPFQNLGGMSLEINGVSLWDGSPRTGFVTQIFSEQFLMAYLTLNTKSPCLELAIWTPFLSLWL